MDEGIDFGFGVVETERGTDGSLNAEANHQGLGAVMTGPDCYTLGIEDGRYIVGVNLLHIEGDELCLAVDSVRLGLHLLRMACVRLAQD